MDALGLSDKQILWHSRAEAITPHRQLVGTEFAGTLRSYQEEAVEKALAVKHGVIVMPPGAGKTVTSLALASRLGLRPLILVHTTDLMNQWIDASTQFLGHPLDKIGGGKETTGSIIGTVCMVQTLTTWHRLELEELSMRHGVLLVDECHHAPAETILKVLWNLGLPRRYGVSATPKRADGLTDLLYWVFGPIVHQVRTKDLVEAGVAVSPLVTKVSTKFSFAVHKQIKVSRGFSKWGKNVFWSKVKWNTTSLLEDAKDVAKRAGRIVIRMVPEDESEPLCKRFEDLGLDIERQVDSQSLANVYKALCEDEDRLSIITERVLFRRSEGRKVLVLAGRVAYCQRIYDELAKAGIVSCVLTGKLSDGKRKATLARYKAGEVMVCIATSLADEGLDVPDTQPLSWLSLDAARRRRFSVRAERCEVSKAKGGP